MELAKIIIGYRIYYGNGHNVLVPSIAAITLTLVGLKVDENYIGRSVSIRSESDQLYSELINVSVTVGRYNFNTWLTAVTVIPSLLLILR